MLMSGRSRSGGLTVTLVLSLSLPPALLAVSRTVCLPNELNVTE